MECVAAKKLRRQAAPAPWKFILLKMKANPGSLLGAPRVGWLVFTI